MNEHINEVQVETRQVERLQMMPIDQARDWYSDFVAFSKSIMKPDLDYGIIPGTPKPSLYKPGAEKLRFVYGLTSEIECIDKTVDIDKPYIDYVYKCTVKSKAGQVLSQCDGSCNSMESKFGFLWKPLHELPEGTDPNRLTCKNTGKKISEFDFAINAAQTTGQYGKPKEYWKKWIDAIRSGHAKRIRKRSKLGRDFDAWELDETVVLYRVPNPDIMSMKNTIMKIAQKRAFVGAMLLATGASEFFTQDIEEMDINGNQSYHHDKVLHQESLEDLPLCG